MGMLRLAGLAALVVLASGSKHRRRRAVDTDPDRVDVGLDVDWRGDQRGRRAERDTEEDKPHRHTRRRGHKRGRARQVGNPLDDFEKDAGDAPEADETDPDAADARDGNGERDEHAEGDPEEEPMEKFADRDIIVEDPEDPEFPEDRGLDNDAPEVEQDGNDAANQPREPFDPDDHGSPVVFPDDAVDPEEERDAEFDQEDPLGADAGLEDPGDQVEGHDMADGYGNHGGGGRRTPRQKQRRDPEYNPDEVGAGHMDDNAVADLEDPVREVEPDEQEADAPNDVVEQDQNHGFENRRIDEDIEIVNDPQFKPGTSHTGRTGGSRRHGSTASKTFHRPGDAHKCGSEDEDNTGRPCRCTGTAWYGYLDKWTPKQSHGSIQCNNAAFSSDPYPHRMKSCYCQKGVFSRAAGSHDASKARRRRDEDFTHSRADEKSEFGGGITSMLIVMLGLFGMVVFIVLFRFNGRQQPSGFSSRSQKHYDGRWRSSWGSADKRHMAKFI